MDLDTAYKNFKTKSGFLDRPEISENSEALLPHTNIGGKDGDKTESGLTDRTEGSENKPEREETTANITIF